MCVPLFVLTLTETFQSFTVFVWLSVLLNVSMLWYVGGIIDSLNASMLWYAEVIIDSLKCFCVVVC